MKRTELIDKTRFFFDNKITVHIEKNDGYFYNGLVLEFSNDMIVILDRVIGEVPIFFSEIKYIEKFIGKEKGGGE